MRRRMLRPSGSMGIKRQATAPSGKNWCDLPAMSRDPATRPTPCLNHRIAIRCATNTSAQYVRCQANRTAKRPQSQWRCVACQNAELEGELIIQSRPKTREALDV
jgi:hypothetical protein